MLSEHGRVSGSFLFAVGTVVALVGGYAAYSLLRPNPYELSERLVRDSRRQLSQLVREFQRDLDTVTRDGAARGADAVKRIDDLTADALGDIDDVVDDARDQLAGLDVALRTQRNRSDRIDSRAHEAREMIKGYAAEAKQKAQGS